MQSTLFHSLRIHSLQIRRPDPLPIWMNTYLPLTSTVWICTLTTLLLCFFFLYVLQTCKFTSASETWLMLALLLEQDDIEGRQGNKSWGLRVFYIFLVLGFFIIRAGYRGALFSCMAVQVIPKPIGCNP